MTAQEIGPHCTCITCSDQGIEMRVGEIDERASLARCHEMGAADDPGELVDIELVVPVAPGDVVLVHAGVALALLDRGVTA